MPRIVSVLSAVAVVFILQILLLGYYYILRQDNATWLREDQLLQQISALKSQRATDESMIQELKAKLSSHLPVEQSRNGDDDIDKKKGVFGPEGIAMLLMTDQPKWFQRRYSLLIQNLLFNLPSSWVVQIYHPDSPQFRAGLELNPGFKKLVATNHSRLHLTRIPSKIIRERKRPIHLMLHPFIWENTLAERVLYLDGNHVLCANSRYSVEDFQEFDYVGAPGWGMFKGQAGGGGISLRNSTIMLSLIKQELESLPEQDRSKAHERWGRDDEFFVSRMIKHNKNALSKSHIYNLADPDTQMKFSSSRGIASFDAFSVSGTLPHVSWEDRNEVINYCPELKTIFPSLHEPSCFGADISKTREKCAATICALNPAKKSC